MHVCSRLLLYVLLCSGCDAYTVQVYRCASDNRTLFSTTLPSLVENECAESFPRFQPPNLTPLRFVQHHGSVQLWVLPGGGWVWRKAGDWGRKPGRGRGIAAGLPPPFPGLSPQASGKTVLRGWSTQTIKKHRKGTGHPKGKTELRRKSTQTIKDKSGSKWSLKNKPTRKKSIHQGCSFYVERS